MDSLTLDLRTAARALVKRPAFTAVAVLTLALGTGANTALFSVIHAVLLRPLPFQDAGRLVHVTSRIVGSEFEMTSGGDFFNWRDQSHLLSGIAAYSGSEGFTLQRGETSERTREPSFPPISCRFSAYGRRRGARSCGSKRSRRGAVP